MRIHARLWCLAAVLCCASRVAAEPTPPAITVGGYLELFYQLHLQNPDNRITNLRGFDNRSRTFTLSNVALDVRGTHEPVAARLVLQIGHTPSTYYAAEPVSAGASGANTSDGELWKYIQVATVTASAPREITIEAGLFPSPIGVEVLPIKDNWNWSRSNLFFGLPAYHLGATVSRPLVGAWNAKLHVYNGWNNVVDNNRYPSVAGSATYSDEATTAQLMYFGGVERASAAAEGSAWRQLFDAYVQHAINDVVSVAGHVDAGFEPNDIGTSAWFAIAVAAKLQLQRTIYASGRADYFREWTDGATPIFWPVEWVASATATLAYQPVDFVSTRFEYRHDHAAADAYFGGAVPVDPATMTFVPNRRTQDSVLIGVTAWF